PGPEPPLAEPAAAAAGEHQGAAASRAPLPPRAARVHRRAPHATPRPVAAAQRGVRPPRALLARLHRDHPGAARRPRPPPPALFPLPEVVHLRDRRLLEQLLPELRRLRGGQASA